MNGLAAQMSGQPTAPPQPMEGGQQQGNMPTVQEVMALLMQGVDPQELIKKGVPQELIRQAIQILEQQLAKQDQPAQGQEQPTSDPAQEQGLAAQSAGMM